MNRYRFCGLIHFCVFSLSFQRESLGATSSLYRSWSEGISLDRSEVVSLGLNVRVFWVSHFAPGCPKPPWTTSKCFLYSLFLIPVLVLVLFLILSERTFSRLQLSFPFCWRKSAFWFRCRFSISENSRQKNILLVLGKCTWWRVFLFK